MVNYNNGLIYKLCSKDPNIKDEYVGSTVNFNRRKQQHKSYCNNNKDKKYNMTIYKKIRETGWDNWDMVLIEKYPCKDKMELHKKEREFIERLKPSLNGLIPSRTPKEYRDDNKEQIAIREKKYYQDNKEIVAEKRKEYYNDNQKEILEKKEKYRKDNKKMLSEKAKEYRDDNKEVLKEKRKEYYNNNKKEILQKQIVKVRCETCNREFNKSSLTKHKKTQKHIKNLSK